ncbi:torsin-3A isoform X2 [Protopterus annectens]|nr:torsin-3A isoform X2 [Protopterus annectens]
MNMFSIWYCLVFECCSTGDCRITNNLTGLGEDFHRKLHGQHLAQTVVLKAIRGFLKNPTPEKALALSFHGWSGTGKNFVARMILENLYRDGMKSECVKIFISVFHFPHAKLLEAYKVKLKEDIRDVVLSCHQSLFIFDEAEKLPPGLLEIVKPYLNHYENVDGVDYRRSIFLFLSNLAGSTIMELTLQFWRAGKSREEITMEDIEPQIREEMLIAEGTAPNGGFVGSSLLSDNLIDFFVPFLPLEYRHVKLCTQDALQLRGVTDITDAVLDEVAQGMVYLPKEERLFSAQGCKTVSQRLSYFLP